MNEATSVNIGVDVDNFFVNKYEFDCPIETCKIKTGDKCDEDHVHKEISIQDYYPFYLFASRDEKFGYNEKLCV
mgnify:CR=1 FL=1